MAIRLQEMHPALAHLPIALLPLVVGAEFVGSLNRNDVLFIHEAKAIEEKGWDHPKYPVGGAYVVVVHGDVAGVEEHRRKPTDWLKWMGLIDDGAAAKLDCYIGYTHRAPEPARGQA